VFWIGAAASITRRVVELVEQFGVGALALDNYVHSINLEEWKETSWEEFLNKIKNNTSLTALLASVVFVSN
jgi:LDH2 family malate/lactate/ureidoglycolate dehydrogenase